MKGPDLQKVLADIEKPDLQKVLADMERPDLQKVLADMERPDLQKYSGSSPTSIGTITITITKGTSR
jgi:hypothetical protein